MIRTSVFLLSWLESDFICVMIGLSKKKKTLIVQLTIAMLLLLFMWLVYFDERVSFRE